MGHYLMNFVLATIGMVGLLYAVYFSIRNNPQFGGLANIKPNANQPGLQVKSVLTLEPRKRIYVVGYGQQQFLLATTMDKTELLATLEVAPQPDEDSSEPEQSLNTFPEMSTTVTSSIDPGARFMDRLKSSFKIVLAERFTRSGGK
jgi:flagellar biogenesis protein FliO